MAIDAERMLSIVENDSLLPVAEEVRGRLARVFGAEDVDHLGLERAYLDLFARAA